MLAGSQTTTRQTFEGEEERTEASSGDNLLAGLAAETLAEAAGVDVELARKLQSKREGRGEIVLVDGGFQDVCRAQRIREEEEEVGERERQRSNGLEESFCSMKLKENIVDPITTSVDFYTPQAGRLTSLNSFKLPILRFIQLSAERGLLQRVIN